jgi:hypothetical protein
MLPRRRRARRKGPSELSVQIGIEEALPDDPLILVIITFRTQSPLHVAVTQLTRLQL